MASESLRRVSTQTTRSAWTSTERSLAAQLLPSLSTFPQTTLQASKRLQELPPSQLHWREATPFRCLSACHWHSTKSAQKQTRISAAQQTSPRPRAVAEFLSPRCLAEQRSSASRSTPADQPPHALTMQLPQTATTATHPAQTKAPLTPPATRQFWRIWPAS